MKLFIVSILVAVVAADRLENTYLPPNSAKTAGGNGNILNTPFGQRQNNGVSNKYGAPSGPAGRFQSPSSNYGAPASANNYQQQQFGGGSASVQSGPDAGAAILKFENENNGDGSYRFEYETENQIHHEESGELKNQGTDQEAQSVQGSYSYMGPDGILYTITYIADENGFRASGDHIPTPPPIPEDIQKSLEQNAAEEASNGYTSNNQGYQGNNGYQTGNGYQSNDNNGYQNGHRQNGNGYRQNSNGNGKGYQNGQNKYQATQSAASASSRQYIPPNKPSFNQQNGYQY